MTMKIASLLLGLTLLAGTAQAAEPASPAPVASVAVADLAWMAGTWVGEIGGSFVEEQWSAPAGGVMMGMYREVVDGKIGMYEFLALESGPEGPILWLRHFNPGLVGWEDKEGANAFHLVAAKPGEATFDNRDPQKPARLIYRREGEDRLVAILEKVKDGKPVSFDFVYRRK